jgi:hypothetical protein
MSVEIGEDREKAVNRSIIRRRWRKQTTRECHVIETNPRTVVSKKSSLPIILNVSEIQGKMIKRQRMKERNVIGQNIVE